MNLLALTVHSLEVALLLYVAALDVAIRVIPNEVCLVLAVLGIASQFALGPSHIGESLVAATFLFVLLLLVYQRGGIGGGDVKLLVALTVGLPFSDVMQLLTVTALTGGLLGLWHLVMRRLRPPELAPAGSSFLRRVYAVERWRHVRRAPLPYGAAIACGGIWTIFSHGF